MATRLPPAPRRRRQEEIPQDAATAESFARSFSSDQGAEDEGEQEDDPVQVEMERRARLDALGASLSKTRSEAIKHRSATGVESEWTEDEEFYEGIDDANRGEHRSTWHTKPVGQAAPPDAGVVRSTIFINITRPYVDAAAARVGDMLLPVDDRGWIIEPTPIPMMVKLAKGEIPRDIQRQIAAQHPDPDDAAAVGERVVQQAKDDIEEAKGRAERAQSRIDDWHAECQYEAHMRQVIEDATRIGTGVMKGPIPEERVGIAYVDGRIQVEKTIVAASRRIDVWNLYPDPACGESIHSGSFIWERDDITRRDLIALRAQPGYLPEAIDHVLEEGPHKAVETWDASCGGAPGLARCDKDRDSPDLFEIWYYHGIVQRDELEAAGVSVEEDAIAYHAQLTMVNNTVIKALLTTPNGVPVVHEDDVSLARVDKTASATPAGSFPYDVMVYQRRKGYWAGISLSRQIRAPQRMLVGAVRNMMDNAGIAGGPMLILKQGDVAPADGVVRIAPRKIWLVAEGTENNEEAIRFLKTDMMQAELQAIVMLALKFAEDITGMPAIMQGQQGNAPDTVGGMQILNNNASTVLRRIARLWDDLITEPHIRRKYAYLLMYGPDDEEKGDFAINARGSSALVERDIENQEIAQMAGIVTNPIFGIDPKKWASEYLKSRRLDPRAFQYDDEEWQKVVESLGQKPPDPRIEIAQMNAELSTQLKQAEWEFKAQEAERDRALEAAMKEIDVWMEQQSQTGTREIELDKIRERMQSLREKLAMQERLSVMSLGARQATTPPTEPAGRAPAGQAYAR